jgi:hypothetical protein
MVALRVPTEHAVREALRADNIPFSTIDRVIAYIRENPDVWRHFERFALEAIHRRRTFGAKAVFDRVRWELQMETGEPVKTDANLPYYYARIFEAKYPEHRAYFKRNKERRGKE